MLLPQLPCLFSTAFSNKVSTLSESRTSGWNKIVIVKACNWLTHLNRFWNAMTHSYFLGCNSPDTIIISCTKPGPYFFHLPHYGHIVQTFTMTIRWGKIVIAPRSWFDSQRAYKTNKMYSSVLMCIALDKSVGKLNKYAYEVQNV